ncbi:hypothetical protein [Bradyrhizobium sp. AUGA SZCCT0283]|uniref:hypothetical protein n=1 Tax=Bradyrhizobium sp. AUGA SZCCT0283 TaxID=2807671 RepID=UPI001BA8080E|nr:hypothetical protein [Bradyrhizobium sp. AUGA SZCCT0283]MBR1275026.1 hypothetical protein [Bradyrhizobium sp. AUGA SZCCT0283]
MIRGIPHHTLEHVDNGSVGRLTQGRKQSIGFAHATMLPERRQREHPLTHLVRAPNHGTRALFVAFAGLLKTKSPRRNRGLFAQTAMEMSVSE